MSQPSGHPYRAHHAYPDTEAFYSRHTMSRDINAFPTNDLTVHPNPPARPNPPAHSNPQKTQGRPAGAFKDTSTPFPGQAQAKHIQHPPPQARQQQQPQQSHQRHSSQPLTRPQPVNQSSAAPSNNLNQQARMAVKRENLSTQEYSIKGNVGKQPMKSALKKTTAGSPEEIIKIKQEHNEHGYQDHEYDLPHDYPHRTQQENVNLHPAYSNGVNVSATPYSGSGQHNQSTETGKSQQTYREDHNSALSNEPRRLRRQASMQATSTAFMEHPSTPSEERQFPYASAQPTIASSIAKGSSRLYDGIPLTEDSHSPTSENPEELEARGVDPDLAEALRFAKDEFDELRIKNQWYPKAVKDRNAIIAELRREVEQKNHLLQKEVNAKVKTITNATNYFEKLKQAQKQKDDEHEQLDRITSQRYEKLSKCLDETVEDMRNFKKDHNLASINTALENVTTTFSNIRTSLNEVKNEIAETTKGSAEQLKVAKEDIVKLKSTVEDQASNIVKLETKIEHYEGAIAPALQKLDGNLAELKKDNEADQPALGNLVNRNIELSDKLSATEKSFSKSLELNESYQTTVDEFSDLLRQHGCEGDDGKTMLKDLIENHANELKEQKDELNKKLEYEIAKAKAGANLVEENHNKLQKVQKEAEASQVLIKEFKDKLKNMEVTIVTMETEKARLDEKYRNTSLQLQEVKQNLKDVEADAKKQILEAVKQSAAQYNEQIKSVKELLEQASASGGSASASDAGQKLTHVQDELRSCQQELEAKTAELNALQEASHSEEDGAAAIKRYVAGGFTKGEAGLVQWARNGEHQDLQRKENAWKNNIKSLTSEVSKLKKELEEKNKRISALTQLQQNDGEASQAAPATSSSKTVKFNEAPRSILTASKSEVLRPSAVNPSRSSRKRTVDVPEDSDDDISSRPPPSQKRAKISGTQNRPTEEEEDSYQDEFPEPNKEELQIVEDVADKQKQFNVQEQESSVLKGNPKTTNNGDRDEVSYDLSDVEEDKNQQGSIPSSQRGQQNSRPSASTSQPAQAKQQRKAAPANSQKAKSKSKKGEDSDGDYQESKTKRTDKKKK